MMFDLKRKNFDIRDAGEEIKKTEIKPNYIYELEAMRINAEEERVKKYETMLEFSKRYNRTCKRITLVNID